MAGNNGSRNHRKRSRRERKNKKDGYSQKMPGDNAINKGQIASHKHADEDKSKPLAHKRKRQNIETITGGGNDKSKKKKSFKPPSDAALALSATLKDLSSKKKLREALDLYHSSSNDSVRDSHHGSIVVDCCARCGAVEEGERIVQNMKDSGMQVSVQANTALLKGYAHSGSMAKGWNLYKSMHESKNKRDKPNVRTLNTLLRGCLWTAASMTSRLNVNKDDDGDTINDKVPRYDVAGGVVTSEKAWHMSFQQQQQRSTVILQPDSSSYEYSISLLCQALCCDEAEKRVAEMKNTLNLTDGDEDADGDKNNAESLAVALAALARAYALLGKREEATRNAKGAVRAINTVTCPGQGNFGDDKDKGSKNGQSKSEVKGGKRAWRRQNDGQYGGEIRQTSNMLFRNHRLSELKSEASSISELCKHPLSTERPRLLAKFLVKRLLYFSGGGTTDLSATKQSGGDILEEKIANEFVKQNMINSLWLSFGLSAAIGRPPNAISKMHARGNSTSVLAKKDRTSLREYTDTKKSIISDDGYIDFSQTFSPSVSNEDQMVNERGETNQQRLLNIELGAGSGDWIVSQARANPSEDYVSVELRADRVAQTFSKCMLNASADGSNSPLENVCCVGSECGSFLRERVRHNTVSTVYVNHPEPPTQTYGLDERDLSSLIAQDDEPAHMLNSETLFAAAHCLKTEGQGRMIIVTDNRWYARLICLTLQKVMKKDAKLLAQLVLERSTNFRVVEVFHGNDNNKERTLHTGGIILYEGKPSCAIGHMIMEERKSENTGTSYFDRLWRTGASTHAEVKKRFIIALKSYDGNNVKESELLSGHSSQHQHAIASSSYQRKSFAGGKKRANKKKSAAKQRRRNERRLAKKKAMGESLSKKP